MARKLRRVGLAAAAILALAAAEASAAQAANEFTATQYPATIQVQPAKGKDVEIVFPALKVTCEVANFQGTIKGKTGELTQQLTFQNNCTAAIAGSNFPVQINMNGCDWVAKNAAMKNTKSISCPAGKEVEIVVFESEAAEKEGKKFCQFDLAAQAELSAIAYENVAGSPEDVVAKELLSGIKFTRTGSFLCGSSGSNAEYVSESTLSAKNEKGEAIGLMIG